MNHKAVYRTVPATPGLLIRGISGLVPRHQTETPAGYLKFMFHSGVPVDHVGG